MSRWIALVGPEIEENLSLRYLASALRRAGYEVTLFAFNHEDDLVKVLGRISAADEPPLLVGLSLAFQWRATEFLALAMALRESGYRGHITAGGHFATFANAELLRDFTELDSICRQEAETTLVNLADAVAAGAPLSSVTGISYRAETGVVQNGHPALPDLATLAWPDRDGEPAEVFGHRIAPLVGSRGCYANCSFCCIAAWHEQALPGKRYRLRPVDDIADEMQWLQQSRGVEIFVFHDDNFFLPKKKDNVERFTALADALDRRGVTRFCTIVKARPTDVTREVFSVLQRRLRCLRVYVGVETDSDQGMRTLRRWAQPRHNHAAIEVLRELGLFACFNVLLFDPDTTLQSLDDNLRFMEATADFPFNFGRVELYAGTPLLARMQAEGRVRGDYLQYNYSMADAQIERVFQVSSRTFHERNFAAHALSNTMMGTRFEIEAARWFHPEVYRSSWRDRGVALSEALGKNGMSVMREIISYVRGSPDASGDRQYALELAKQVRRFDASLGAEQVALAREIHRAIGVGSPLTHLPDVTATPLQKTVLEELR